MKENKHITKKIKIDVSKNQRLKQFYELKGLSQEEFANKIDASQPYISAIVNNKRNIGSNILNKIKYVFEDFNEYWFLNGEGEMLVNDHAVIKEKDNDFKNLPIEEKLNIIYNQNIEIAEAIAINKEAAENNKERIDDVMFILDTHMKMIFHSLKIGIKKTEEEKLKEIIRSKN